MRKDCLAGAFEMHVHTSPDVSPRRCSDIVLAERLRAAGFAGALIKCHFAETAARAALLNERFPGMSFFGGVALNNSVGGTNPRAVEACGKMGGKVAWFATMNAHGYLSYHKRTKPETDLSGSIKITDDDGKLKPEAVEVIKTAKKYSMMVATGHVSAEEGLAAVRECAAQGVQAVLTHADNPADCYTTEQQVEAVSLGAVVEHSYFTAYYNRTPIEAIAEQVRAIGCANVILSTDFGQPASPYSDEGLFEFAEKMSALGFSDDELRAMFADNPRRLLGLA